ncbi:MAG: DinB family protein [Candidatus Acidiferrales bacterium]
MTPEEIRTLYDFNSWANHRTLEACAQLTPQQFLRDIRSSFRSVRDTLAHILEAERIWLQRFEGRSASVPVLLDAAQFADLKSLRTRWARTEAGLARFLRGLTQADLDRVIEYKTTKGVLCREPLWQPLLHLVNHGTYHRGQITTLLRQLGAQPAVLDMINFFRERNAAAGAAVA